MKHNCKYPNKLNIQGYFEKISREYEQIYSELNKEEIKNFLWFILVGIDSIIENSESNLDKILSYLLRIDKVSKEEYISIPSSEKKPKSAFNTLFLIMYDPMAVARLIANNMNFLLREEKSSQYEKFLQNVAIRCSKEIAETNKLTLNSKAKSVQFKRNVLEKLSVNEKENIAPTSKKARVSIGLKY